MEALAATSFDRYARYSYTHRLRTQLLPAGPLRILDVGDPYGTLASVFPDDLTVSVDLFVEGAPTRGDHQHVLGSGFELPFPDGAFDLVAAHDVLEHLPDDRRRAFVHELLRVGRGPVVVVAPFADPRTSACERLVNAYYVAHNGSTLEPLDEHAEAGLPDLERLRAWMEQDGTPAVVYSDGWLFHWLAFMLLKAHYVTLGAEALDRATDASFNHLLRERDARPPHYRRAVILRPPAGTTTVLGPDVEVVTGEVERDTAVLEQLAWELAAALPIGEDPSGPNSALRDWIIRAKDQPGDISVLADSLEVTLDEACRRIRELPTSQLTAPASVSAIVLAGEWQQVACAVSALAEVEGVTETVVAVVEPPEEGRGDRMVVTSNADHVLQLAAVVSELASEAILVVDPRVSFAAADVAALISAYGHARCVGYHYDRFGAPEPAQSLRPDHDDSLYVARGLMLIDRQLYRSVGGLDGRFRGVLDDVDLGWRLNLIGERVVTIGEAWWACHSAEDFPADVAVLWCWLKNLEQSTLERKFAHHLMRLLARPIDDRLRATMFEDLDGLLRARAETARRRVIDDATLADRFGQLYPTSSDPPASESEVLISAAFPARPRPRKRAALIVSDPGSADRMTVLASMLAGEAEVLWAGSGAPTAPVGGVRRLHPSPDLRRLAEDADVVVVSAASATMDPTLWDGWEGTLVVDVGDAASELRPALIQRADVVLCQSEHQRDFLLARFSSGSVGAWLDSAEQAVVTVAAPHFRTGRATIDQGSALARVLVDIAGMSPLPPLVLEVVDACLDLKVPTGVAILADNQVGEQWGDEFKHRGVEVLQTLSTEDRTAVLATATVVIRPMPSEPAARLGSSAWALDALAAGVPVITTTSEPASTFIASFQAGIVTGDDPRQLAHAARRCLDDHALRDSYRFGAVEAGRRVPASGQVAIADIARRPWHWRLAHGGGIGPLSARPIVSELIAARDSEVARSVAAAVTRQVEERVRDEVSTREVEYRALKERLGDAERALEAAEHQLRRIRMHPVVRLARLVRSLWRTAPS